MTVEEIRYSDRLLALVVHAASGFDPGVRFLTEPEAYLQLATMRYEAGHRIAPHLHPILKREILRTQEVLLVRSGRIRISFYSEEDTFTARELGAGDMVLFLAGGHGVEVLEDAEMVEVKQGPYLGRERDKRGLG